jgi:hypothetical protein
MRNSPGQHNYTCVETTTQFRLRIFLFFKKNASKPPQTTKFYINSMLLTFFYHSFSKKAETY